ncbi:MAG: hypothetical protein OXC46_05055 [Thaumarchaeota archaeon]|nr:hypothetical protein [Nitrososphaerota archaeon]
MLSVGIAMTLMLSSSIPLGESGMSAQEAEEILTKQQEIRDMNTLAGILIGVGFLLVLISFGARRRKGSAKREEKKPAAGSGN